MSCAPHNVCYFCVKDLRKWATGKKKAFIFGIPMAWREQKIVSMISIFAVAMLRVTTLKIRNLSCTLIFLRLYALLLMAQRYLYVPQPTEILEDTSTNT
jgi:hypothetical protein